MKTQTERKITLLRRELDTGRVKADTEGGKGKRKERGGEAKYPSKKEKWIKCKMNLWRRRCSSSFDAAIQVCFL